MNKKLLFTLFGLLMALPVFARDFSYTYEGQTLTYTVIDEEAKTCMTKEGGRDNYYGYCGNDVSGGLIIPSVAIDNGVEYAVSKIGYFAFYNCNKMTSVSVPNSVKTIAIGAFAVCSGLTSVNIGNSVTTIGNGAFAWCSNLTKIMVDNANLYFTTKDGVLYNKDLTTLVACPGGKTAVDIPDSVVSIEEGAFSGCNRLTSVNIPNSVKIIGMSAFNNCNALTSVNIPGSVTSIGEYAFAYCNRLKKVYYAAKEPISGNYIIFGNRSKATLYVPEEAVEKCKQTYPWKNFAHIRAYDFSRVE